MYEFEDIIQILRIIENYFFFDQRFTYISSLSVLSRFNELRLSYNMNRRVPIRINDYSIVLSFDNETEIEIYPRNIRQENIQTEYILNKHIIYGNIDSEIYNDVGILDNTQLLISHYRNDMYNLSDKELSLLDEITSIILES